MGQLSDGELLNPAHPQLSSIGRYRLIATIGRGGMAHVHLAASAGPAGFNKLLVIKALREDVGHLPEEMLTMFLDEARLAARLNHPNIVQTYEVGESDGRYFIAMEYLEGQSLRVVERRIGRANIPVAARLRILSETAKGLHHAHELSDFQGNPLNVVHRDVSPQNVFVTYEGQVKLLDFGIAKAASAEHLTRVGVIKGKADYLAPEQIRGEVDRRADIFALGVMLWEALAERRFAGGPDVPDITKMHARLSGSEPRLREVRPDLPPYLIEICERALALDPAQRQQTAREFADEIDAYLLESGLHPTAQQLRQLISPAFAADRAQIQRLIEQQMKAVSNAPEASFGTSTGSLPVLPSPRLSQVSGVWTLPPSGNVSLTPSGVNIVGLASTTPAVPSNQDDAFRSETGALRARPSMTAAIAIASVFVAAAIYLAVKPVGDPNTPTSSPLALPIVTSSGPAAMASAAQAPFVRTNGSVRVRIQVHPKNARITLDTAVLQVPVNVEIARAPGLHELVVTADGYETHREMITFDRDQSLTIMLDRPPPDRRRSAPRAEVQAQPAPSVPSAPAEPPKKGAEPGMDLKRVQTVRLTDMKLEDNPYQ